MKARHFALFAIATAFVFYVAPLRAETGWVTDYKKAQESAKTGNKLILADFTGSDWCGWCIKLNKEVFSKPEFKQYASKNLVLLELDFPQHKYQSREVKQQNEELSQQFGIQGYPTVIVLNGQGKKVGQLGYMEGGPSAFIAALEKLPKS